MLPSSWMATGAGRKNGVCRGWLGIEIQEMTPALAESFDLGDQTGIIIAGILRRGPADRAGLKPGDIILSIDGQPVQDAHSALNLITQARPGQTIHIQGLRNRQRFDLKAEVSERPT